MNHTTTQLPARQRGGMLPTIILLVLIGAVITTALKIVPAYQDDTIVQASMLALTLHPDFKTMSIADIRKEMLRALTVNNVENFNGDDVQLNREAGKDYVDIVYERRIPLVANISAVVAFNKRYNKF